MSQNFRLSRKCNEEGYKFIYDSIAKSILKSKVIMIGKIGANELLVIYQTIGILQNQIQNYSPDIFREGIQGAGIYPCNKEGFIIFAKTYLESIKSMNIMASWNDNLLQVEEHIWNNYIVNSKKLDSDIDTNENNTIEVLGLVDLCSLESFYTEPKYWWQNLYENKTILVITPFAKSIQTQLDVSKRDKVWKGKWNGFWSKNINFKFIKFPHPYLISSDEDKAKFPVNLDLLMKQHYKNIDEIGDFDIALIGAGAYSILLCDYIKRVKCKTAFHLGGGLQMMFGVYGHRWEPSFNKSPFLKEYINDDWIRPLPEEIPPMYKAQENGAYF